MSFFCSIDWGDVPTWIAAVAAVGASIAAYLAIRFTAENLKLLRKQEERLIRNDEERARLVERNIHEGQAREINAWVARGGRRDPFGKKYIPEPKVWIAASNRSNNPVYEVVVMVAIFQNEKEISAQHWSINPVFLMALPPGLYYFSVDFGLSGAGITVGAKVLFRDSAGNSWLRDADGSLTEIDGSPLEKTGWAGATIKWSSPSIDKLPPSPAR